MSEKERNIIEYMVCCVSEFANRYNIKLSQAFAYLDRFKGVEFLNRHYDIEHTLSFDDVVDDLTEVCINNGGLIK